MQLLKRKSMQWIAVTIEFKTDDAAVVSAVDIVCDIFYSLGFKGVVIDDAPDGGGIAGKVTGYVFRDAFAPETLERLRRRVAGLSAGGIVTGAVSSRELDEQDWAHFWKEHFRPVRIGRRLVVKPTWRDYDVAGDEIIIEIDPGMAFGTGTHPTTTMCLEMMEAFLRPGDSFFDIGTGSGILMIAADKLGASVVRGVDNDPVAVRVAAENLRLNRIPETRARVMPGDLLAGASGMAGIDRSFDFIAVNIQSETVAALVPVIAGLIVPGGLLVCSGIIEQKTGLVREALSGHGFAVRKTMKEQPWVCIAAGAPGAGVGRRMPGINQQSGPAARPGPVGRVF